MGKVLTVLTAVSPMPEPDQETVSRLLAAVREGDEQALHALFPLVYDELHALAQRKRRGWHGDYTMNTTALVHEAYLKLVDQNNAAWASRAHFFAVAAKAMRHILINYAERRRAKKRGGDVQKIPLDDLYQGVLENLPVADDRVETLLALDQALEQLEQISERQSQIVECRFFGGMTIDETAAALNISPATVKRGWAMAQAWLYRALQTEDEAPSSRRTP